MTALLIIIDLCSILPITYLPYLPIMFNLQNSTFLAISNKFFYILQSLRRIYNVFFINNNNNRHNSVEWIVYLCNIFVIKIYIYAIVFVN